MLRSAADPLRVFQPVTKALLMLASCMFAVGPACGLLLAAEQPQLGIVRNAESILRSGPGEDFYSTAKLPQGTSVEIYRMAEGGWCGIRPPEGSFSYVRADDVRLHPKHDSILVTEVAGTKTHVGSLLSADVDVEYIALNAGEPLKRVGGPVQLGKQRWYRISPPSGEFRWIHIDDLQLQSEPEPEPNAETASAEAKVEQPLADLPLTTEKLADVGSMTTEPIPPIDDSSNSTPEGPVDSVDQIAETGRGQWTAVTRTTRDRPSASYAALGTPESLTVMPIPIEQADVAIDSASLDAQQPAEAADAADFDVADQRTHASRNPSMIMDEELAAASFSEDVAIPEDAVPEPIPATEVASAEPLRTAELELRLSQIVSQDVGRWQLSKLRAEANRVAQWAADAQTRAHALTLLDRIAEFDQIKMRHESLQQATARANNELASAGHARLAVTPASATVPIAPRRTRAAPPSNQNLPSDSPLQVSARGWLVPVETSRGNTPQFALTSQDGEILYFVSPAAGLDLRSFENQPVAMLGRFDAEKHGFALIANRIERIAELQSAAHAR